MVPKEVLDRTSFGVLRPVPHGAFVPERRLPFQKTLEQGVHRLGLGVPEVDEQPSKGTLPRIVVLDLIAELGLLDLARRWNLSQHHGLEAGRRHVDAI